MLVKQPDITLPQKTSNFCPSPNKMVFLALFDGQLPLLSFQNKFLHYFQPDLQLPLCVLAYAVLWTACFNCAGKV